MRRFPKGHYHSMSSTPHTPRDFLRKWIDAVNHGDVDYLSGLYDAGAVLIPTFSNRLLSTPERIRGYFEKLAKRDYLDLALHENTVSSHAVTDALSSLCGIYCWRFAVDGEVLSFEARFSYMLDFSREAPILQHHSSQIPRML